MTSSADDRKKGIVELLIGLYPKAKIALRYRSPWELLVAVILSAQCTDVMVNKITPKLFAKFPSVRAFADADISQLEQAVRPTGFFRNKARNIKNTARKLINDYQGQVPDKMDELIRLPGVARKTANIVLANAFGINAGIAVDTHVSRISQRLRLVDVSSLGGGKKQYFQKHSRIDLDFIKDANSDKIERQLIALVPEPRRYIFTYALIDHGRSVCKAVAPRCQQCALAGQCPASRA
ncbi:hypothetical protein A2154_00725 [Candidatus Gottesmanbacteria bacterium RBG_16_43_7]|uniref:Endonuclease III n=1 Tax=Candidatus Gottesmanbacteria bacterium RBG_16_43_7 TaxID=1798373 RepID=A0A1F5Z842_9BACT|nr:MAG: hypothetical protein A2154_00725 [Candidatus Gottesmanbacteria bacterium RBG_16_43_7]